MDACNYILFIIKQYNLVHNASSQAYFMTHPEMTDREFYAVILV